MRKNALRLLPLCALLLLMAGCFFKSGEEMFSLPQPPEAYLTLQTQLRAVLDAGMEYAAPLTGSYTQPVQLIDLDGNGQMEAVAFFRSIGSERPLRVHIFRETDGAFETAAVIEGNGSAFHSVTYASLSGDAVLEIIVGWQMSPNVYALSVYDLTEEEPIELLGTGYSKYAVCDMTRNGRNDLILFYDGTADQPVTARLYNDGPDGLNFRSAALLSKDVSGVGTIKQGLLEGRIPALYVSASFGDGGRITDILAVRNGNLTNITLDPEMKISAGTLRYHQASVSDIDGDGQMEVPLPMALPSYTAGTGTDTYWVITWWRYSLDGTAKKICTTSHNYQDDWYLILPNEWEGRITVLRREQVSGERAFTFAVWNGEELPPTDFLTIYQLTGANRQERARAGNRFTLRTGADIIYAAAIVEGEAESIFVLSRDELSARFKLIVTDWNSGEN